MLASLAALCSATAMASGAGEIAALNDGYRLAFGIGALARRRSTLVARAVLLPRQATAAAMSTDRSAERADQAV